jgi:hypothetical protein
MWLLWSYFIISGVSIWSGRIDWESAMPFIFIGSPIQIFIPAVFVYLVIFFLRATISLNIKKKQ